MIASIRAILAILVVAFLTITLAALQLGVLRTGWFDEKPLPRAWHRLILKALGFRVHVRGRMDERRPLLLAANHISWTDVMVLGSVADIAFIAKSEMADWPVMGRLARLQRTLFVERERRGTSGKQASEIGRRLAAGDAMVLFPEGTTADGNFLLPFKSTLFGAARLALEAGTAETVLVQPVAISYVTLHGLPMGRRQSRLAWIGDMPLLPHILALLRAGAVDVEVGFGEPAAFAATSGRKDVARLMGERVREMRIRSMRGPHEK